MQTAIIIIFIINILYMVKKIGLNRKIFSIFLSPCIGMIVSTSITCLIQQELNMIKVGMANFGICLVISFYVVSNLEKVNSKTEDIFWKELFRDGIIIGANFCIPLVSAVFLAYYMTQKMPAFTILSCIGIIVTMIISAFTYSVLNSRKTIYKKTAENKIEGQRSLKL